jgi:hypothetical protein
MKNIYDKFIAWLFLKEVEYFKLDAVDKDNDGLVQEGTPFERKVKPVKKAAAKKTVAKKTEAAKKTTTKKTTAKKTVAKKTAPKKK